MERITNIPAPTRSGSTAATPSVRSTRTASPSTATRARGERVRPVEVMAQLRRGRGRRSDGRLVLARLRVLTDAATTATSCRPRHQRPHADRGRQGRLPHGGELRVAHTARADQALLGHVDAARTTSSTTSTAACLRRDASRGAAARAGRPATAPGLVARGGRCSRSSRAHSTGQRRCCDQVECIQREQPDREFSITIADNLPAVMADDHMTAQVLANLLSNAVRFSPDASPVEVKVEYARSGCSRRSPTRATGIEGDDRERIFERFTTVGGPARTEPGVGLGLYIVRRVGRGHGRHGVGRRRP